MAPPPSDAGSGEIRLGVFYDFSRKELLLRFDSGAYARAYQAKNPEGRILADNRKEVWLPLCDSMRTLRSSDTYGMVIIFRSKEERRTWLHRSVLGSDVDTSEGEYGVRFKRSWSKTEIEQALEYSGSARDNLLVPKDGQDPYSRPGSSQKKNHPRSKPPPVVKTYYVPAGESRASERHN